MAFLFALSGAGAGVASFAIKLNERAPHLFFVCFSILVGIFLFLSAPTLFPFSFKQAWPLIVVFSGLVLSPAVWRKYKMLKIKFIAPSLAFIALGVCPLVFSFRMLPLKSSQFILNWRPLLLLLAGVFLISLTLGIKTMRRAAGRFLILPAVFLCSCATQPAVPHDKPNSPAPTVSKIPDLPATPPQTSGSPAHPTAESAVPPPVPSGGAAANIAAEIRALVYSGIPSSLLKALNLIRAQNLSNGEFGRTMNAVIVYMLQSLYPGVQGQLPASSPPQNALYTKILLGADKGIYTAPPPNGDYLECVLPFLALIKDAGSATEDSARLLASLPDLERAVALYPNGVAPRYFIGFVYEKTGRFTEARAAYSEALALSKECYPAALGLARLLTNEGQYQEAAQSLSDSLMVFPGNMDIKRQLAITYYEMEDWPRADSALAEIVQKNNKNGDFILMYARTLIEREQFARAQSQLDAYALINAHNPHYLFLQARVQAEGFHNRDAALNYLRVFRNAPAIEGEALAYMVKLLLESDKTEEQAEGKRILAELLVKENPSLAVIELAAADAIRREAWGEARPYVRRLLDERRSSADLANAYTVEHGLNNNASALAYARELFQKEPSNTEAALVYIAALIDTGRTAEAASLIDARLSAAPAGAVKSSYYYLRSRTRSGDESRLNDLRSSLFEHPRNLQSLIAMFEYYYRQGDRRALYYLKQALAIDPDNIRLKRYEKEYAN
ncbi:MAG: tetratricopeptide repeat protein [Treponema sp.]|nr:tetratricopeptide repeat protein [Treponema sp.]